VEQKESGLSVGMHKEVEAGERNRTGLKGSVERRRKREERGQLVTTGWEKGKKGNSRS